MASLRDKIRQLLFVEEESHYLLAGISLTWVLVIWLFEPAYMIFSFDDSFYYLKVASNIVAGFGITFDRINTTNGFHPLWMFVATGFTGLLGDHAPFLMRTLLTLQVTMVYVGTNLLASASPLQGRTFRIVTALLLANFYCTKILVNGQESALQYLMMCIALLYWWRTRMSHDHRSAKAYIIIGLSAGMVTLTRIDAVVFSAVLISMPLLWPSMRELTNFLDRLRVSAISLLSFLAVVAPYAFWNIHTQGHILPVSAAVKIDWRPILSTLQAVAFPSAICLLVFMYWLLGKRKDSEDSLTQAACFLFPILCYSAAESIASFWMSGAFVPPLWYMPPYLLLLTAGTTILLKLHKSTIIRGSIVFLGLAFIVISVGLTLHRFDSRSYSFLLAYRDAAHWLDSHTGPNALVGSWDAGIMASHSERSFINLDGLINSWDYKINYLDKGLTEKFINEVYKVDYVCQRFVPQELTSPTYRGVNLSDFYVAWFDCVEHHQIINFLRTGVDGHELWSAKPHYAVILSRKPTHGTMTFAQFISEVAKYGGKRCARMK